MTHKNQKQNQIHNPYRKLYKKATTASSITDQVEFSSELAAPLLYGNHAIQDVYKQSSQSSKK